ncbi:MAG: hypothetical protein LBE23_10820 [Vagococcus sp.]|jgi:hypothetical protein|nr:hypothetical protein [Vagococcus sp.]
MFGIFDMFKPAETFVIAHSEEIKPATIKEAGQLINYVIGVNNDLIDRGKSGWLIVKKTVTKKKIDTDIFAMRLDLPLLEDNPYFTNLLEPFYQSKPVEFDESLLLEMEETVQDEGNEVDETPTLPSNLESLVKKGTDVLEQEETLVPIEITESSNILSEEKNLEYEQEIERLKLELEAKNDLLAKQVQKEKEIVEFQKVVQVENTKDIPVSNEFPDIVGSALQSRLTQLEQEIKQRDTRSHIKESIVNDFQDKKKKAIENKLIELEIEKNVKLEKPKADYELLVKQIVDEHNQIKEKEMKNITDYYEKECQIKIKNETEKHSEELANYLNEQKNELLNWQKSFNNDIESQLGSMYYVFQLPVEE